MNISSSLAASMCEDDRFWTTWKEEGWSSRGLFKDIIMVFALESWRIVFLISLLLSILSPTCIVVFSCDVFICPGLKRYDPLKFRYISTRLHGVTSQKTVPQEYSVWQYFVRIHWSAKTHLHGDDEVLSLSLLAGSQTVCVIIWRIGTGCAVPGLLTRLHLLASYHKASVKTGIHNEKYLKYCQAHVSSAYSDCSSVASFINHSYWRSGGELQV